MKQKLGLACTLVRPPEVLLLDEPTVGVDPVSRRELWAIIYRLVDRGMGVVVSTAYLDEAERCQEVLLLHRGRLLDQGPPADFAAEAAGRSYSLSGLAADTRRHLLTTLAARDDIADVVAQGQRLRLLTREAGTPPALPAEAETAGGRLEEVPPRFEDAFIARLLDQEEAGEAAMFGGGTGEAPARRGLSGDALALSAVTHRFGDFTAVDRVGFRVQAGEIFGLLGPNGAGKSTLIKIMCGLLPPSTGRVEVAGVDARKAPARVRGRLGYMSQQFSLYGDLTPVQNLRFFCRAYGLRGSAVARRIGELLEEYALEEVARTPSAHLPLGYKQRLALATALLHRPDLVLLDEPTSGVDPLARRGFWRRINQLAGAGVTVLVTTHFLEEAEYCDRLGVIHAGRLAALDTPDGLRGHYRTRDNADPSLEDAFVGLIQGQASQTAPEGEDGG
jgi:ABC-2 type transport system ATP-binding protein